MINITILLIYILIGLVLGIIFNIKKLNFTSRSYTTMFLLNIVAWPVIYYILWCNYITKLWKDIFFYKNF